MSAALLQHNGMLIEYSFIVESILDHRSDFEDVSVSQINRIRLTANAGRS